ncbi:MAG: serine hydrolase domain-containing protein [Bacteroidota bacterium]
MKSPFITLLLCISCLYGHTQLAPPAYDSIIQRLGNEFSKDTATAGLSIGILYGKNTWFYNFGKGNPDEHSIYEIGSITKTFISLVLAHALTEGKVSLTDDVRKYLEGDFSNLAYKGEPIRLVNLANTTSALPDNLARRTDSGFTKLDFLQALAAIKPDTIPGTKARHSNVAAALLAYIMEAVYKEPIDVLVNRYILEPLQMTETSFGNAITPTRMMKGYKTGGEMAAYLTSVFAKGTGSMRSTTSDMIKYLSYLQAHTTPESKLSLQPTVSVDAGTNKVRDLVSIDMINDRVYGLSLNWLQYHPEKGNLRIWTDGGTAGFRSYIVLYPESQLSLIFLSNRTGEKILDKMYTIGHKIFRMLGDKDAKQ